MSTRLERFRVEGLGPGPEQSGPVCCSENN